MNTEKMIPMDFSRNITPFVPGDVYYNNFVDAVFTMDQRDADEFNNADPRGEFNTYFIVSFADRPNTTGKQPIEGNVRIDATFGCGCAYDMPADYLDWSIYFGDPSLKTWKPNHAALLAKFKEQGANTMTKLAEQKRLAHAVALMTNALDDNPDEPVPVAESMPFSSDHYVTSPKDFGAVKDDEQVIEPWVADQLDDLINPVSEGCQADDEKLKAGDVIGCCTNPKDFGIKPEDFGVNADDKPVFTQEMAKAKQLAPIGSKITYHTSPRDDEGVTATVIGHHNEWMWILTDSGRFDQITMDVTFSFPDNRSDEERLRDAVWESTELRARDGAAGVVNRLLSSDKFTITLNK